MKKIILASTGGSGSGYTLRMLYHLSFLEGETHWIPSQYFFKVLQQEFGLDWKNKSNDVLSLARNFFDKDRKQEAIRNKVVVYDYKNAAAQPASGSVFFDGMVVLPCSGKTLSGIANGYSQNLIERAADVSLKERRPLLLVFRESPYSLIHIENMRQVTLAGGRIVPASPGFFHHPQNLNDIYDFMVDRIFLHLGIQKRVMAEYNEKTLS